MVLARRFTATTLEPPTPQFVRTYVERCDREQAVAESALGKLFHALPKNTSLDGVLLKALLVNHLYRTSIYAIGDVAAGIFGNNIGRHARAQSLAAAVYAGVPPSHRSKGRPGGYVERLDGKVGR